MKISNLRIERHLNLYEGVNLQTRVICDVECAFCKARELYFSVDDNYGDWLTADVYDAFLVAALYPAMYYKEPIEVEGCVSKKLYHNILHYVFGLIRDYDSFLQEIPIHVKGFANAEKLKHLHVGTGFSGGVDSFSTIIDNFENENDLDYKIDSLFFFHVGQYGNVKNSKTWERAYNRFSITKNFAVEIGVNAIMMNTNLFDYYQPHWEYDAGVLCRIASVLIFQKTLKRYYISNTCTYKEMAMMNMTDHHVDLAESADPIIMPLLSPEGLDILCDGAQYSRTIKTQYLSDYILAQKYLNVCVDTAETHVSATNCGHCSKCLRTMMALESAGSLEKFNHVFDLQKYKQIAFLYKCQQVCKYKTESFARDNIDFARSKGKKLPSKQVAFVVLTFYKFFSLPYRMLRRLKIK